MNETLQELLYTIQRTAGQVSDTAADAAYGMGKKAEALLSTAKLNIRVVDLKSQISAQLKTVGEMIYATHTGTPTDSDDLLAKLQEIDELNARLAELNALLGRREEAARCSSCGAVNREGDQFCRECGTKL